MDNRCAGGGLWRRGRLSANHEHLGISRPSGDSVLDATDTRRHRQAERVPREGKCHARVRFAAARLSRVGAESARYSRLIADARVLREQPAAQPYHQGDAARGLLQRYRGGWLGERRGHHRVDCPRRAQGVQFYTIRQTAQARRSSSAAATACSAISCRRRTVFRVCSR